MPKLKFVSAVETAAELGAEEGLGAAGSGAGFEAAGLGAGLEAANARSGGGGRTQRWVTGESPSAGSTSFSSFSSL